MPESLSDINRQNKNCGFKFLLLSRHIHYARNWWYSNSLEELSLGNIISLSFYESPAIFIVNYMAGALIKVWHSLLFVIYVPEMFYLSMILLRTSANAKCMRMFFYKQRPCIFLNSSFWEKVLCWTQPYSDWWLANKHKYQDGQ